MKDVDDWVSELNAEAKRDRIRAAAPEMLDLLRRFVAGSEDDWEAVEADIEEQATALLKRIDGDDRGPR